MAAAALPSPPALGLLYDAYLAAKPADLHKQVTGGRSGFPESDLVGAAAGLFPGVQGRPRRDGRQFWVTVSPGTVALASTGNPPLYGDSPQRGQVHAWSDASRRRMMRVLAELDYSRMEQLDGIPAMTTLTLPGDWLAVAPTAAAFKRHFLTWRKRFERAWGVRWVGVWKLEFQRRGAPHLHLYMIIPRGTVVTSWGAVDFKRWCSLTWADVVAHPDPEQRRRHVLAGVGVDLIAGMKASDPKRLAVYFCKHASPATGLSNPKEYQHSVPLEWAARPGRFWGYVGLEKCTATTQLSTDDFVRARRLLRRWSRSQTSYPLVGESSTRPRVAVVRVRRGDLADGSPRFRRVTRRRMLMSTGSLTGGFTMSNDGAQLGAQIARALDVWRK